MVLLLPLVELACSEGASFISGVQSYLLKLSFWVMSKAWLPSYCEKYLYKLYRTVTDLGIWPIKN